MDEVIRQLSMYDGITKSNSTRKDDAVAAISLLYEYFRPRIQTEIVEDTPEEKRERERVLEEQAAAEAKNFYYNQMFGPSPFSGVTSAQRQSDGTAAAPGKTTHAPTWKERVRGSREPEPQPEPEPRGYLAHYPRRGKRRPFTELSLKL